MKSEVGEVYLRQDQDDGKQHQLEEEQHPLPTFEVRHLTDLRLK